MSNSSHQSSPIDPTKQFVGEKAFSKDASRFWDEKGPYQLLHQIMPWRMCWLLHVVAFWQAFRGDFPDVSHQSHMGGRSDRQPVDASLEDYYVPKPAVPWEAKPLGPGLVKGLRVLDVGSGGGLMAEPLARLGAKVMGIDPLAQNVGVAKAHAVAEGLSIDYQVGTLQTMLEKQKPPTQKAKSKQPRDGSAKVSVGKKGGIERQDLFDMVMAFEVIEHVHEPFMFLQQISQLLKPGGLCVLSTPDRSLSSYLKVVVLAEKCGWISDGSHAWDAFLTPHEVCFLAKQCGFSLCDYTNLVYRFLPRPGWILTPKRGENFFMAFIKNFPALSSE